MKALESILEARNDGPLLDLFDFCTRIDLKKLNKRVIEKLICACLRRIWPHRASMMATFARSHSRRRSTRKSRSDWPTRYVWFAATGELREDSKQRSAECTPWPDPKFGGERNDEARNADRPSDQSVFKRAERCTSGRLKDVHPTGAR